MTIGPINTTGQPITSSTTSDIGYDTQSRLFVPQAVADNFNDYSYPLFSQDRSFNPSFLRFPPAWQSTDDFLLGFSTPQDPKASIPLLSHRQVEPLNSTSSSSSSSSSTESSFSSTSSFISDSLSSQDGVTSSLDAWVTRIHDVASSSSSLSSQSSSSSSEINSKKRKALEFSPLAISGNPPIFFSTKEGETCAEQRTRYIEEAAKKMKIIKCSLEPVNFQIAKLQKIRKKYYQQYNLLNQIVRSLLVSANINNLHIPDLASPEEQLIADLQYQMQKIHKAFEKYHTTVILMDK